MPVRHRFGGVLTLVAVAVIVLAATLCAAELSSRNETAVQNTKFDIAAPPVIRPAADFNADGRPDIAWANPSTGQLAWWGMGGGMHGEAMIAAGFLNATLPAGWHAVGVADVDGDGHSDVFLESDDGHLGVWFFDGSNFRFGKQLTPNQVTDTNWQIRAVGDFNHDGHPDLAWEHMRTGSVAFWLLDGTTVTAYVIPYAPAVGADWVIVGAGDSDRDGNLDLFWQQQSTGALAVWHLIGTVVDFGMMFAANPGPAWHVAAVADLDGDAYPDFVLQNSATTEVAAWYFAGPAYRFGAMLSPSTAGSPEWRVFGPR